MAALTLAACQNMSSMTQEPVHYYGAQMQLLDNDLVQFQVTLSGTTSSEQVARYAECVAAQYTLIRSFGFARHVHTRIGQEADRLSAGAVYTISRSLPQGTKTIDAEVVADACARDNIPMV